MKNKNLLKTIVCTIIFTMFFNITSYAADGKDGKDGKIVRVEYEDIEDLVLKENLQIKVNKLSIDDMKDALDEAEDAGDEIDELQDAIYEISDGLDAYAAYPDLYPLAQAIQFSLELTSNSLGAQVPSNDDADEQIRIAELGYEQADVALVNTAKKMFVLYHQLDDSLNLMKENRKLLVSQLDLAKYRLEHGLIAPIVLGDMKKSLLEFDNSTTSLMHQKEALILNFKDLIGISMEDEITFGLLPDTDTNYILKIDLEEDLEKALKNSLSIKTKKVELSSADSKMKKYQLQIKESEISQSLNNQYQLLIEKLEALRLSESELSLLNGKLFIEDIRYKMGQISLMDYKTIENQLLNQRNTVKTNSSNLFIEIENYKSMLDGMI